MKSHDIELDEVMIAMDAIDTLRREADELEEIEDIQQKRELLKKRLESIYRSSGIEVDSALIEEGIRRIEEERFAYTPPPEGFKKTLAKIYVTRSQWIKPLLKVILGAIATIVVVFALFIYPEKRFIKNLPTYTAESVNQIVSIAQSNEAIERAKELQKRIENALKNGDTTGAKKDFTRLKKLYELLNLEYQVRIVQDPSEYSGVWRIPKANPNARNYYLIVEAIDEDHRTVEVKIKNEETGNYQKVKRWGLRVDKETFQKVAKDKKDDGIIQNRIIGHKRKGQLKPSYTIPTNAQTITKW